MTISEFRIALDLGSDSKAEVLEQYATQMSDGNYLFVDSTDGSCHLFDGDGNKDDISKLTYINEFAFYHCNRFTSIIIPDSVTSIENWVFYDCRGLTSVTIGNSVASIGGYTFYGCNSLKKLIFKGKTIDEVKSMDNYPWEL